MTEAEYVAFVKDNSRWLMRVAERFHTKDPEAIVQEVFTRLWIEHKEVITPKAWVTRVLRNLSLGEKDRKHNEEVSLSKLDRSSSYSIETHVINRETLSRSLRVFATLPTSQQVVLRADLGGVPQAQTAKSLHSTERAVKMVLFRARQTLREKV